MDLVLKELEQCRAISKAQNVAGLDRLPYVITSFFRLAILPQVEQGHSQYPVQGKRLRPTRSMR